MRKIHSVRYGIETTSFVDTRVWNILPSVLKQCKSLELFENKKLDSWNCPCKLISKKRGIEKETLPQVFSCEFCEISKNTCFREHLLATASETFIILYMLFPFSFYPPMVINAFIKSFLWLKCKSWATLESAFTL